MAGRFSIEAVFKAVDKVTRPVSRMQNRIGKFTRVVNRGFNKLNRTVGKFTASIKGMAVAGTASFVAMGFAIGNLITTGAEFGRAIGSAAAKFPDQIKRGTKEFRELEKAARDVGATTEFTAIQAAKGLNFLAKAGFTARFSTMALADIVNFATAAEIELAEAADIASDALGAFSLDAVDPIKKMKNLNRVMDVMSKTANSSNTSVSELFEAVRKGGPIAVTAGSDIETFSALMGFLASNSIKASQAGTAAKNVTLALAGVGNKAAVTFRRLGISLADSNGDMRDQLDVLDDLRGKLSKFGEKQQVEIIAAIFGKLPIAAAAKLVGKTGESVRGLRLELQKAGGSSKQTAAFIRDDVKGSLDGLTSAIEGVKISIFSLNEGPLKKTIDRITEWVRANEKLIASKIGNFLLLLVNNLDKIIDTFVRIAKGVAAFIALNLALKAIAATMAIVNLLVAANPIVLIILAAVAAVALLSGALDPIIDTLSSIGKGISAAFGAVSGLSSLFGDDEEEKQNQLKPKVVSPFARHAQSIEERRTTNTAEITIKDDTNRAEVTKGKLGFGSGITLQPSGNF